MARRMNVFEDLHAHALAGDEAVMKGGIDRMGAAQVDALFKEGRGQHLFQARLRFQQTSFADWRRSPLAIRITSSEATGSGVTTSGIA